MNKAPYIVAIMGVVLVITYAVMTSVATFFSVTDTCNYTLVVPFDGGIAKADCINFNSLRQTNADTGDSGPHQKEEEVFACFITTTTGSKQNLK